MITPILKLGTPVLHQIASPVAEFGAATQQLVDDMIETMHAAPGIGLAAPQVGVPWRVFVVDLSVGRKPAELQVFINPEIVERSGFQLEEEGCLSVPGFTATVLRPTRLVMRAWGRDGQPRLVEGTGLLARALQHEFDHLDGLLYLQRLRGIHRAAIQRGVRKLEQLGQW